MKKLLMGGVVVLFAAAAAGWWWHSSADRRLVESRVVAVLTDPDSAVFKGIYYNPKHDVGCGLVNAKNRMGGMVGMRGFLAFNTGEVRAEPDFDDPDWKGWNTMAEGFCSPTDPASQAFWDALAEHRLRFMN